MSAVGLEVVPCPYCGSRTNTIWATELGFTTARCTDCDFLFLNPRPSDAQRSTATQMGVHMAADGLDISERYIPSKTQRYIPILREQFGSQFAKSGPISWVDIGAGYGETMDAVSAVAPAGSTVIGVEPMHPKASAARARGLQIYEQPLGPGIPVCDYASLIDVFSHINDFDGFLQNVRLVLKDGGEFFMETGHLDGRVPRDDFPSVLGSPDHVSFATDRHIKGFLERNGFEVLSVRLDPIDDWMFTIKNVIKKAMGRDVRLQRPFASRYRTMFVRARKLAK